MTESERMDRWSWGLVGMAVVVLGALCRQGGVMGAGALVIALTIAWPRSGT